MRRVITRIRHHMPKTKEKQHASYNVQIQRQHLVDCKSHSLITLLAYSGSVIFHTPLFFKPPLLGWTLTYTYSDIVIRCEKYTFLDMRRCEAVLSLDCSTRELFLVTKQLKQTRCQVVSGWIIHIEKVPFDTVGPNNRHVHHIHFKLSNKIMLTFYFVTANMLKEIFDHIPLFWLGKKNAVLNQNLELN